jgi:AraC-like DNA-binding protein
MPATRFASIDDWDEVFTGLHGASRISVADRRAPWTAHLQRQRSSNHELAFCAAGTQQMSRGARHIRTDPRGTMELLVPLAGTAWVEQGGSAVQIRSGQLVFCDVDRPFTFTHDDDFRSIAVIVAGQDIALRSRAVAREPRMIDATRGLGRVVHDLVTTVQEEGDKLSELAFDSTCERLLDLACLAAEGGTTSAPESHRGTVEAEIRQYVRRHAAEHDLGVTGIAKALGWSPRYIQQVLQTAGTTPRELIRHERLAAARLRLAGRESIAQIALACGFGSHAGFATAFRHEFGMTPSEARSAGRHAVRPAGPAPANR